ncbi:MAG TPA: choice-of-anchor X domain-containing protein, partial [Phycisphaerales bacterium]|nr:choice-of-anchor X domain-containing protein [Phycisphaerales bacterium]
MKSKGLLLLGAAGLSLLAGYASAQCTTYIRTTGGGTVEPGVTDIGNHADDTTTTVALPFTVNFYGVDYNTAYICSNGWVSFAAGSGTGYSNVCLAANTGAVAFNRVPGPVIFAHWDDLTTAGTGNGIFTSVTGDPGSQVFHIEWRTNYLGSANRADFEVRLFEGSPRIEIIHGNIVNGGASATVGIQQTQGTFDQFSCSTAGSITNGSMIRYFCDLANPSGSGSATPNTVAITGTSLLKVAVTPAQQPPSTGVSVTANLTAINGSASQAFYDDGSHGDQTAGDGVFSYLATAAEPLTAGTVTLPFTVTDAQSRSFAGSIPMNLTAAPVGGCCTGGTCGMATMYNCTQGGGTYLGDGSDCSGTPGTQHATGDALPAALPDFANNTPGMRTLTVTVPAGSGTISNLGITLGMNHTWVGDVIATISNGTTTATFINRPGVPGTGVNGFSDNLAGEYRFTGLASASIDTGCTNVSTHNVPAGAYQPFESLAGFNGQPLEGTWTITLTDNAGLDTGSITSLSVYDVQPTSCGTPCPGNECGPQDYNGDGDSGTDQDIEAFFACLGGTCCETCYCQGSDFN